MTESDTHSVPTTGGTKGVALGAILFGLVTLKAGGSALFIESARQAAGNYVPFVLWFNFLAGFLYVIAGVGIWQRRVWSAKLSLAIDRLTLLVFAAFGVHVAGGGSYEMRTVGALTLRSSLWVAIAFYVRRWGTSR